MGTSMTVDLSQLNSMINRFTSPSVQAFIMALPQQKAIAALVGQAIADNFRQEGPGWTPLKAQTIRSSVSKKIKKSMAGMSDKDIEAMEAKSRKDGGVPNRRILQKTRMLMKSVTVPGFSGPNGGNIYKVEGTNLVWGTSLPYAAIHNEGGIIKNPGTKNGFGRGIMIKPHSIPIPKREFLVVREMWMNQIMNYMVDQIVQKIHSVIKGGA